MSAAVSTDVDVITIPVTYWVYSGITVCYLIPGVSNTHNWIVH